MNKQRNKNSRSREFGWRRKPYSITDADVVPVSNERYEDQQSKNTDAAIMLEANNHNFYDGQFMVTFWNCSKTSPWNVDDMKTMMNHVMNPHA